jgi:membrane fusion protein (multidrug efflux system)
VTPAESTRPVFEDPVDTEKKRIATPRASSGRQLRPNLRRWAFWAFLALLIVGMVVGGLLVIKLLQFKAMSDATAQMVVPPEPVNVVTVLERSWQPRISAVGSITAVQGTVVSTEAEGVVRSIKFDAGSEVETGTELVQLDIEVEQAELRAAEAAAELARISFNRARELIGTRSISQAEFDSADANLKQSEAKVDNLRAVISRKIVRAPFTGKLGIKRISVGDFLEKGSPLVSLQSLDPVHVEFSVPQQRLGELVDGLKVIVSSDAYPGQNFEGEITAINSEIDPATRNIRVQATLGNSDGRLRPGMFVTTELILARSETALFIPATAVQHSPFGDSVFLVEEGNAGTGEGTPLVAQQQFVRLGERHGDYVVVTEGLNVGDQVVSAGGFKLRPGVPVVIDNTLAPTFEFEPTPGNT